MTSHLPGKTPAAEADGPRIPAASRLPARRLTAVMLLAAAALDLTRCGVVLATARHAAAAVWLVSAGLAAAALSLWAARGCQRGRRWSGLAALLIGAGSAPQAAVSGFHAAYSIPDTATAALGVLLTVGVLATAGRTERPGTFTGDSHCWAGGSGEAHGNSGRQAREDYRGGQQRHRPRHSAQRSLQWHEQGGTVEGMPGAVGEGSHAGEFPRAPPECPRGCAQASLGIRERHRRGAERSPAEVRGHTLTEHGV
jgi:hypothetical protein